MTKAETMQNVEKYHSSIVRANRKLEKALRMKVSRVKLVQQAGGKTVITTYFEGMAEPHQTIEKK